MSVDLSITRRGIIQRWLGWLAAVPLAGAVVAMLQRERGSHAPVTSVIPPDVPTGLSIVESAVVYRSATGEVRAYSNRCTHLGCRIDRVVGDEAVCPCHGSRYRSDGTVSRGPAPRSLTPLRLEPRASNGGWTAHAS